MACITNYINGNLWDVIIHPCTSSRVDTPLKMLKGPAMRKAFPCHDVTILDSHRVHAQGLICECTQPMRDDVALQRRLSLAGCIHKMIPVSCPISSLYQLCLCGRKRPYGSILLSHHLHSLRWRTASCVSTEPWTMPTNHHHQSWTRWNG